MTDQGALVNPFALRIAGDDIMDEVYRQHELWGVQSHPDGTGGKVYPDLAGAAKTANDISVKTDTLTWSGILFEEVMEAFAETDPKRLREELVQVAAVATNWVMAIDRRGTDVA